MPDLLDLATAAQTFQDQVELQYQNMEALRGTVKERHGSMGEVANIPVGGIAEMAPGSFGAGNIPVSNIAETNVQIMVENHYLKTAINAGARTLFAYDQITEQAREHAKAAARFLDKLKLNAIFNDDGTPTQTFDTIAKTVGANTGLNVQKIINGLSTLQDKGVEDTTSLWMPYLAKQSLMADPQFTSWDFNVDRPLMNDNVQAFMNVTMHQLGNKGSNRIPYTDNAGTREYQLPMVSYDSIMAVFNRDVTTDVIYRRSEDRYEFITKATAKAGVIQPDGIILIAVDSPFAAN